MFKRKARRRPVVRRRVKYPQIRANPEGFCKIFKFSSSSEAFNKRLAAEPKQVVYESVVAFTVKLISGDSNKVKDAMNKGLTNQGQNDQYKKGLILLACFFGLLGDNDASIGSFGDTAQYYAVASKFIQKALEGEVPSESGDPFTYWPQQYKNALQDLAINAVVPTNWNLKAQKVLGSYSPDLGTMWSKDKPQAAKRDISTAQIKALQDRMKVLLSNFNRAFGPSKGQSAKKTKRRNAYLPFAFNLELRTRTAPLPAVADYMEANYKGTPMGTYLQPTDTQMSTIKALLVVARLNGNAQVFISTKNPVSVPTYRKFAEEYKDYSKDLKYWVPIVEMKTFQEGPLIDSLARSSNDNLDSIRWQT